MIANQVIRPARLRDVHILSNLFTQSLQTAFDYFDPHYIDLLRHDHSHWRFTRALCSSSSCFFLALDQNRPIGYSLARMDGPHSGFIHWMYVHPDYQGQGVGRQLLVACQRQLFERGVQKIRLMTHNQANFYKRAGYIDCGSIKHDRGGVTMTIMEFAVV